MVDLNLALSIIMLNIHELNISVKRQKFLEWIKQNHDLAICCLQDTNFKYKDTNTFKVFFLKKTISCA